MKNTFKRFLALVMVLCTVAAWMIPGVSVNAAELEAVTYYFDSTPADGVTFGTSSSTPYTSSGCYWFYNNSFYNWTTAEEAFKAGTLNWKLQVNSSTGKQTKNYLTNYVGASYDKQDRSQIAIEIAEPAPGTYKLNVNYLTAAAGFDTVRVYITEAPEVPYTRFGSWSSQGTLYPAMPTIRQSGSLNTFSTWGTDLADASSYGTLEFEIVEGKDYLIIFDPVNVNQDVTSGNANFHLKSFTMVPVVQTDYEITYHANYEGAEGETAGDDQNVIGSLDTAKTFTLDAVPFNRPSFALRGWATTPNGRVVYQPGDEITLSTDAPTMDLYAVWKEIWTGKNHDLTVNFKNDFTTAGVPAGSSLVLAPPHTNDNVDLLDAAYQAGKIQWTTIRATNTNEMSYNGVSNGGYFRAGEYLGVSNRPGDSQKAYPYAGVPLKFKAPGTGEYKLSFTYGKSSVNDNGGTRIGAYIKALPEAGTISRYTSFTPYADDVLLSAIVENPGSVGTGTSGDATIMLEFDEEYTIVFFVYDENGVPGYADYRSFTLTEVKPEASINDTEYKTVEEAVAAAVSGDTIKLVVDADVAELNLANGVTLDLNGKTLTAGAVAGTIIDSTDGAGLLAVAQDAAVIDSGNQLALWDNTNGFQGYRVFNYTFKSLDTTGTDNKDMTVDFAAAYTKYCGTGSVTIVSGYTLQTTGATITEDYEAGTNNWGIVCGHRNGLSSAQFYNKSLRITGRNLHLADNRVGGVGLKIVAPGSGWYEPSVRYVARPGTDIADNLYMYILPLPTADFWNEAGLIDATKQGYELNSLFNEPPSVSGITATKVLATSVQDPEMSGTNEVRTATGEPYLFEAGKEYMVVLAVAGSNILEGSNKGNGAAEVLSMSFNCVQSNTSFWSHLKFTNSYAYTLAASGRSGLTAGFEMDWNGAKKTFQFEDVTIAEWALAEEANVDTDYGFYLCMRGFEAAGAGVLKGVPYVSANGKTIKAEEKSYTYTPAE